MKALEFIYQENEIHFLINPSNKNVMINATEMAKVFGKKTEYYLKSKSTKEFIEELELMINKTDLESERLPNGRRSDVKIIENRGHKGIYFDRRLALDFAAWLDVKFRVWIFETIDEIIFGHYKKHWEAHAAQETAKIQMESLKQEMLTNPTPEIVAQYFEQEKLVKDSKNEKTRAIKQQLKLFNNKNESPKLLN